MRDIPLDDKAMGEMLDSEDQIFIGQMRSILSGYMRPTDILDQENALDPDADDAK